MAAELQAEIARARVLRADALSAAGATAPPSSTLSDVPDAGFGYRTSKVQKQVLGEVRGARLAALENRASNLLPDDQRHKAFEKATKTSTPTRSLAACHCHHRASALRSSMSPCSPSSARG